jgi:hypothetical protein
MPATSTLVLLGGICHFGVLIASSLVPFVLEWKKSLAPLRKLNRQLIWTYGAYTAGTILSLGILAVTVPHLLTDGSPLGRIVCGFIATFWGVRLLLQFFVFDSREYLTNWWLTAGHHLLTYVFIFVTAVFAYAAIVG